MQAKILIVDDEPAHRQMIRAVLDAEGYAIDEAADGKEAVNCVRKRYYDLILMDIRMSKMSGIEALKEIKLINPGIAVIVMTAYASVSTAVEALKSGAYDYLTKPLDIDQLKILIAKALHHQKLEEENINLKKIINDSFNFSSIIGRSSAMVKLLETVALVSPSEGDRSNHWGKRNRQGTHCQCSSPEQPSQGSAAH